MYKIILVIIGDRGGMKIPHSCLSYQIKFLGGLVVKHTDSYLCVLLYVNLFRIDCIARVLKGNQIRKIYSVAQYIFYDSVLVNKALFIYI